MSSESIDVLALVVSAIAALAGMAAAAAGVVTALGTLLLAIFAYRAWSVARATLDAARLSADASREAAYQSSQTVIQMREDSAAMKADSARKARPYVYLEVVSSLWGPGFWDLVVRNEGRSIARNIQLHLNPEVPADEIGNDLVRAVNRTHTLTPSSHLRFSWRVSIDGADEGMPAESMASVTYQDDKGMGFGDEFLLDAPASADAMPAPTVGAEAAPNDPDPATRNIRLGLEAIATHLGELRR